MRVALLGAAHIHIQDFLRELNAHSLVSEIGLIEPDESAAQRALSVLTKPCCRVTLAALPTYEAAIIASETDRHEPLLRAAIEAKLPIFVEKPMLVDDAIAQELAAAVTLTGQPFHTGYFYREIPAIRDIKQRLNAGELGTLRSITMHITHDGVAKGWFRGFEWMLDKARAGYGGFGDLGLHAVDLICWLANALPTGFEAKIFDAAGQRIDVCETVEFTGRATLYFPDDVIGRFTSGWRDAQPPFKLHLIGSNGEVYLDAQDRMLTVGGIKQPLSTPFQPDSGEGLKAFLDYFITPHDRLISVQTAVERGKIMNALYTAAEHTP